MTEHVSATERFTDDGMRIVPWTAELAMRVAGAAGLERDQALEQIRDAIDTDRLPPAAVDALIAAGWTELSD